MKKQLCMLAVLALASSAFAQGTIGFNNNSTGVVRSQGPNDPSPVAVPANGGWVQLLWNPSTTATLSTWNPGAQNFTQFLAANPGWALVPDSIKALNGPGAGRVTGGVVTIPTTTAGAAVKAAVVGWTGNFASVDAAFAGNALMGASAAFTVDTADPTSVPPGVPTSTASVFPTFTLTPTTVVPEPSTFALAGLGAAALLAMRRRK